MKGILILVLLSSVGLAAWTPPVALFKGTESVRDFNSFVDEAGNTHIAYCLESVSESGDIKQDLRYARFNSKNEEQKAINFAIKFGCRVVKISPDANPKSLIIAFEGKRKVNLGVCNRTHTAGCYDIYTVLSKDAGNNWGPVNVVPRFDKNDVAERLNPHIAVGPVTKQVYLVYTQRSIHSHQAKLLHVFKNKDSDKFSEEYIIDIEPVMRIIDTVITQDKTVARAHIFYECENEVKHKYIDEEIVWKGGTELDGKFHYTRFAAAGATIVAIYTDGVKSFYKYSPDHGNEWSMPFDMDAKYHKSATAVLKPDGKDDFNLALLTTGFMSKDPAFKTIKLHSGSITSIDPPFKDDKNYGIFMPQLRPYTVSSDGNVFRAFGYIWCNGTAPSVFVSDYAN